MKRLAYLESQDDARGFEDFIDKTEAFRRMLEDIKPSKAKRGATCAFDSTVLRSRIIKSAISTITSVEVHNARQRHERVNSRTTSLQI